MKEYIPLYGKEQDKLKDILGEEYLDYNLVMATSHGLPIGDSGYSQINMVTDVYSHIIDEDRRKNAEMFEEALLSSLAKTMKS